MHWIVVADAGRARMFTADALLDQLVEHTALVHPNAHLPASQRFSDNQARLREGTAAEPHTDERDRERQVFAREVAVEVGKHVAEFERLVLVAPPQFLGALRKELARTLPTGTQRLDIAKDLSKLPAHELGPAIKASLPETAV